MWEPIWNFTRTPDRLLEVCTDENKVVCEWDADPNNLRVFESTNGVNGHAWNGSPTDAENRARCVQPRTAAGICDDYSALVGGQSFALSAVSVFDIGECSSSLPVAEFAALLTEEWRKGNQDRLGTGDPPNSDDVALWSDVTVNLKNGDFPPEMFFDWTIDDNGNTKSEMVARNAYRVDGDLDWSFDRNWHTEPDPTVLQDGFGQGNPDGISVPLSLMIQGVFRFNPLTFWLPLILGNCEKDRPAVVQMRGAFEATDVPVPDPYKADIGGIGVKVNSTRTCGPVGNWPCSWASVLDWPARPWCNNHVKGRIQDFLLGGSYAQFGEQPNEVRDEDGNLVRASECFTCTSSGSILPFEDSNGNLLPIRDVVLTPTRAHFVHFTEVPHNPADGDN